MTSIFLRIADDVMRKHRRPMSAREIVALAEADQLFPDNFTGSTPHQTLKSKLSVHIRRNGDASPFVRTGPGKFYLRELLAPGSPIYDAPPLHPPKTDERVLVFPAERLDALGRFQGIRHDWKDYLRELLDSPLETLDRYEAETVNDRKQFVTYVLVTRNGREVLAYRRGAFNRVEHFLRGSDCVGFGGHVAAADRNLLGQDDHGITQTAIRELQEELSLPDADRRRLANGDGLRVIGLLNDDSSPAGRRHFGVVFQYDISDDPEWDTPMRGEKSITRLRWISNEADAELNDFEYWSQLCLLEFHKDLAKGQPSSRVRRITPFRPPHAVCIVGQIGSGKSEAADLLQESMDYAVVNSGQVLATLLGRPVVTEESRSEFQAEAQAFIEASDGPDRLASAIAERIDAIDSERIIVDGIRQRATFTALREKAGRRVAMLYVHSPAHIAYEFYNARSGSEHSFLEFAAVREAQVEAEVPTLIGIADAVLFNWQGVEEYRQVVREFLRATQSARQD